MRAVCRSLSISLCAFAAALLCCAPGALALPDGRVYEMVTPPSNEGAEVYEPTESLGGGQLSSAHYTNDFTEYPFQVAADGERVAFVAGPTSGGSETSGFDAGNEYLAVRSSGGGWTQMNISPAGHPSAVFQAFSSDLRTAFLDATEPLSPLAPGIGETAEPDGNYDVLYAQSTGGTVYEPLFTARPPFRSMTDFKTAGSFREPGFSGATSGGRFENKRMLVFAGASADASHVLFLANDALTGASEGRPAAEGGAASHYESENNLYESVDGQLQLVNVLPDGTTQANATFGGGAPFSHVISADGSRVFWTDLATGHIYVRVNGTTTVEISSAGQFRTATSNGSKVLFTNGDLYEYEVEGARTTDLTPGVAVERVVGASENGEYIYYVTSAGKFELWHNGATTEIPAPAMGKAEVTPDGHSVVFISSVEELSDARISVYDADTGQLFCASCGPTATGGALPMTNQENVYQPRWISADGSRVFFDSFESLVPQDTNGHVVDVYEWERPGAGSCTQHAGCVYLLSGGTSTQESYLADADEQGDNVFIVTRAQLVEQDVGELYELYDARADGHVAPAPPTCTGTGCQGIPPVPPIFATPASATFAGVGDFPPGAEKVAPVKSAATHKPSKKPKKKTSKRRRKPGKASSRERVRGRRRSHGKGGRS
ncbi:MAG: hypothetical protein FWD42_07155 [Solirubrobacterales bacterium]|nr:hypothetical protein [Solirubrobacterales bacterium]